MECERRWGEGVSQNGPWCTVRHSGPHFYPVLVGRRSFSRGADGIQHGNFLLTQANMRRHERDRVCTPCSRGSRVTGTLSSGVDCTRSG